MQCCGGCGGDKAMTRSDPVPFEEAVALTGTGRFHYRLLFLCGLCMFSSILDLLSISYVSPAAQCDFQMTSGQKGLLNAILYIGMICSSHLWGFLADTQGRRKILILTLSCACVCSFTTAFMPNYELLLITRFFSGFFICGPSAVTYPYLGEFHSSTTRSSAVVQVTVFLALGLAVEPALAWLVIPQDFVIHLGDLQLKSWRLFILLVAIPSGLTALSLRLFLPESPKYLMANGKEEEALRILQTIYSTNTRLPKDLYPVTSITLNDELSQIKRANTKSPLAVVRYMWRQTVPLFRGPYLLITIVSCVIQFGLYCCSNGFLLWMPDLFNRVAEYSTKFPTQPKAMCEAISALAINISLQDPTKPELVGTYNYSNEVSFDIVPCNVEIDPLSFRNSLIIGSSMSVAYILISVVIKYVNKKIILVVSTIVSGTCGIATLWAQTVLQVLLLPLFFILLSGMCVSIVASITMDVIPTQLRAMAVCLSLMCGRMGVVCTSLLLGFLIDTNCVAAIGCFSGLILFVGALSLLLPTQKITHR